MTKLLRTVQTRPGYKLYALTSTQPRQSGLIRVPGFVAAILPPLGIATCEMNDGTSVKCFICEPYAVERMPDITRFGGWRAYSIKP